VPAFVSKQGNLPKAPVYSGILEMDPATNQAILGTENGVWVSDNIETGEWYFASPEIGRIPVMAVKQRTFYKPKFTITFYDPGTGEPSWEIYHEIENYKDIYVATHGRGVFRFDMNAVGIDEVSMNQPANNLEMEVYPNPATTIVYIGLNMPVKKEVRIDVFDFSGRLLISQQTGQLPAGHSEVEINIGELTEGTYLLQCSAGNSVGTRKFIVVK
jgi:hypothetical protein